VAPRRYSPRAVTRLRPVGAIVLAAGLGTRMKSSLAKVLHHLAGRPLISYPLAALRAAGVDPIVVVVGHQAAAVRAACEPYGVRCAMQDAQKGTGHATLCARGALADFAGDVVLVNGDLPFLCEATVRRLVDAHRVAGAAVSVLTDTVDAPHGFGRIVRDATGQVSRVVEERDAGSAERKIREINVGVYCANAAFLFDSLAGLQPTNKQGELYLTDVVAIARAQGRTVGDAPATAGEAAQVSTRSDLAAREAELRRRIVNGWLDAGVTIEDPATAYIGPDVTIGPDTIIGPNVILHGRTRLGESCRIEGSARLLDARLGDRVHVRFGVVMTDATVDDNSIVGPFAHLRPGTHLGPGVHIGDFVETKNAVIRAGTKANHLAYLGDVEIGSGTNIGAGTITCNYDGFHKYRTVIGDRVQVGSDTQLVAPVTIGDDAYIASGTTVTKDVPAGTLAFNVKRTTHRDGWVAARRRRELERAAHPPAPATRRRPAPVRGRRGRPR
jgi:bifunctional UDP-N-acetylglucosamine pyrophosphorylase/glucosamine-1-phosphate N-acetyltransferase